MSNKSKFEEDLIGSIPIFGMILSIYLVYSLLTAWSDQRSPPKTDIVAIKGLSLEFEFNYDICSPNHRSCTGKQRMFIGIGNDNECYMLNYPGSIYSQRICHERYQQIIENRCIQTEFDSQQYCSKLLKAIQTTGTMRTEARAEYNPATHQIENVRAIKSSSSNCPNCEIESK